MPGPESGDSSRWDKLGEENKGGNIDPEFIQKIKKLSVEDFHHAQPRMLEVFRKEREAGRLNELVEAMNKGRAEGEKITAQQIDELLGETSKTGIRENIQEMNPYKKKE